MDTGAAVNFGKLDLSLPLSHCLVAPSEEYGTIGRSESWGVGSCPNIEMLEAIKIKNSHARITRKIRAGACTKAIDFIHHSFTMKVN